MTLRQRHRHGFTLIEMLIVGSLIALFAGLAMFGAQQMYDSNRRKAMLDECKSVASALSFARQDVGFYPRIHALGLSQSKLRFPPPPATKYYCQPALDALGYYGTGQLAGKLNPVYSMKDWRGPYMTVSEARALNASGRRTGLVRMRLPDKDFSGFPTLVAGEDPTLVDWPTDTWGNPYVFYMVCSDTELAKASQGQNPKGLRLSKNPAEEGDFFMAVVSYGPNHTPGGNDKVPGFGQDTMLYVPGDLTGKNQADFTLKSVDSQYPPALLDTGNAAWVAQFAQSIESKLVNPAQIGITDDGSDDVFFKF